jgi:hypothetical protein
MCTVWSCHGTSVTTPYKCGAAGDVLECEPNESSSYLATLFP